MPRPTLAALLLVAMAALTGCSSGGDNGTVATTAPTSAGDPAITIASFNYQPKPLTVAPGAKIPVTNSDSAEHTVTSDASGLFLADDIKSGKTVTFTAPTRPGTYTFHCQYHPSMHGTLVVR